MTSWTKSQPSPRSKSNLPSTLMHINLEEHHLVSTACSVMCRLYLLLITGTWTEGWLHGSVLTLHLAAALVHCQRGSHYCHHIPDVSLWPTQAQSFLMLAFSLSSFFIILTFAKLLSAEGRQGMQGDFSASIAHQTAFLCDCKQSSPLICDLATESVQPSHRTPWPLAWGTEVETINNKRQTSLKVNVKT